MTYLPASIAPVSLPPDPLEELLICNRSRCSVLRTIPSGSNAAPPLNVATAAAMDAICVADRDCESVPNSRMARIWSCESGGWKKT